ncbi:MAG: lysophospholipid acyltransferase family protein [Christensenellales bacterium]|jgi:1-acyl-sn-glycerol-3-phosphate acyltransferase
MKTGKVGKFYRFIRPIGAAIMWLLFRPQLICTCGALPEGAFIGCANHISMWDPYAIAALFLPKVTFFLSKSELEKNKLIGAFLRSLGAIPVDRGTADHSAIRTCMSVINDGNIITIFPEGTRNKKRDPALLPFHKGFALIAAKTNAPCIPLYVDMKNAYKPFHRLKVYAGDPVSVADILRSGRINAEGLTRFTEEIRIRILQLRDISERDL